MWTAWLGCLQMFLLDRLSFLPDQAIPPIIIAPPLLLTWIGSRFAKNPFESPSAVFWKGAAVCCLLTVFANICFMNPVAGGSEWMVMACLFCGLMLFRGSGIQKIELKQGELFDTVQAIARRTGVPVQRVTVFKSPRNIPSAFAHQMVAILISDSLLRILSRRETDAVIAHEAAHLRPSRRVVTMAIPSIAALGVVVHSIWPGAMISAPLWPIVTLLVWRWLRRVNEYDADAKAVDTTRDPEALITALTRVSSAAGMPLHWGALAGIFMPHPAMTARFRAIARRSGIASARVDELIATALAVPSLPGYVSPFEPLGQPIPNDSEILSSHCQRVQKCLGMISRSVPILMGAAASASAIFWRPDFAGLLVIGAGWVGGGMMLYCIAYELLIGLERRRLRNQIPDGWNGHLAGFATAIEPRIFDGMYHYDLGAVKIDRDSLTFKGARCTFSLQASQAIRVWLAKGPRHWTPRKVVCITYEAEDRESVVSLQSMERWFWPGTSRAANELLQAVTEWSSSAARSDSPIVLPPRIVGAALPRVSVNMALHSMKLSCLISMFAGLLIWAPQELKSGWLIEPFLAPLVTAALSLFALAPYLTWGSGATPQAKDIEAL